MHTYKEAKVFESQYLDSITKAVHDICENEKKGYDDSLESFELYRKQLTLDALTEGKAHLADWTQGFRAIINELSKVGDQAAIQQLIQGVAAFKNLPKNKPAKEGTTVASLIGYDVDLLEKIYGIGRQLFEQDQIGDAAKVFALLVTLDPGYAVCWTALGIILHAEKHFEEGLAAFSMACQIDEQNPIPYLYCARCHKKLGQAKEAEKALKLALIYASGKQQYAAVVNSIKTEQSQS